MQLLAKQALMPGGWASNVRIEIDTGGCIGAIECDANSYAADQVVELLLPGMPNVHSHAFQRAMAGLTEYRSTKGDSFWSWRDLMYRFAARLQPEQVQVIAAQLYLEMLRSGYTSAAEFHYLHHDERGCRYADPAEMSRRIFAAVAQTGIALTHLPVLYRYSGFGEKTPKIGQQRFLNDAEHYAELLSSVRRMTTGSRHRMGIAPHSLRAVSKPLLHQAIAVLDALDATAPIHIHIAEQMLEVNDCVSYYGQRPVAWLNENVELGPRWCLVHATHMNAEETAAVARSGAVAAICTTTEANLGDGFFPVQDFLGHKGAIAIGSDSHISVSPAEELRWLEYGVRLQQRNRAVICSSAKSVGRMLYEQCLAGGARAMGQQIGTIELGAHADFITLDTEHPLLYGKSGDAILDSFIFAGNQNLVRDVMVSGHWHIVRGHHADEERIGRDFKNVMKTLLTDL